MEFLKRNYLLWISLSLLLHVAILSFKTENPIKEKNTNQITVSIDLAPPSRPPNKTTEYQQISKRNQEKKENKKHKRKKKHVNRKAKKSIKAQTKQKIIKYTHSKVLKKTERKIKTEKITEQATAKSEVINKEIPTTKPPPKSSPSSHFHSSFNPPRKNIPKEEKKKPFSIKSYISKVIDEIEKHKTYPALAKRLRVEGKVILEITIDKDGTLVSVKVIKPAHRILNNAAVKLVKNCNFPPLPKDFKEKSLKLKVPINYVLK